MYNVENMSIEEMRDLIERIREVDNGATSGMMFLVADEAVKRLENPAICE